MYSRKDYVPRRDSDLLIWSKKVFDYATKNAQKYKVPAPDGEISDKIEEFEYCLEKTALPNSGKVDTLEKNEARKALVKDLRVYIQGFLARNPNVTNVDRENMGLPIYDTIPTPVGDPVGLVTATFKYPNEAAIELHLKHVDTSPFDERANYGVKIRYGVFAMDEVLPTNVSQLQNSLFTRKKRELFKFDRDDRQKTACFCMRYENSKGKPGQWGGIVTAIIP